MNRLIRLTSVIAIIIGLSFIMDSNEKNITDSSNTNPFFTDWNTPFEIPPFLQINDDHYMPAFEKGMEENLNEIEKIINNSEIPTFSNTIEELERSGKLLSKVQRVFYNLSSSNTNPKIQELQLELSPILSTHYDKIILKNKFLVEI